ncbi:polysaccharide biosynthesis/export family protein [Pigmentiphaga aceris]|uniref:polysaccharide biosynthesis/export family protein n=1 Tax=Pigmentiphaga aceris TaxID=1940612 RepID=UPI001652AF89|nr:polysaccharide biosynthesis/export family protein [Pigmentiphaga aceris]
MPGPYLGVVPDASTLDRPDFSKESVKDRADIFSISPQTIAQMVQDKQRNDAERAAARAQASADLKANGSGGYRYTVGKYDILLITVWNHPELNNPSGTLNELSGRVVSEAGTFFYPYAGKVQAVGRTVDDIRDELTKKLATYLVQPQVDVSVLTYRSQRVFALGQLTRPGVVPVTDVPMTVTDLISQTGGLTPEADLSAATLLSRGQTRPVNLYALYYEGDVSQDVRLSPGDILTVPESRYNKVFVMGEVTTPQSRVMPRGRMSLAEALSDAGGFNPLSANTGQLYVIRNGQNNRPQIWHLNASSPDALVLADRFDLQPRDIVYVDPTGVTRFGRVLTNILPAATAVRR